jgi:hypothetical protein
MTDRPTEDNGRQTPRAPAMPLSEREYRTVRLDADLVKMADYVRRYRKITVGDYLAPILRAQVEADYEAAVEAEYRAFRQKYQGK